MEHSEDKSPTGTPPENEKDTSKIFVKSDESWKEEAQKEKEKLQERAETEKKARDLPPPSFPGLINDLGLQAMLALGLMKLKEEDQPKRDLPAARYTIDLLGILEEKTRGNLAPEEKAYLTDLIQNLRLGYAKSAKEQEKEDKKIVEPDKKIIT